jgi:peptidoglycan-associated lipoprotein
MQLKRSAMYVTLALCGALATGCASQDGTEQNKKKSGNAVSSETTSNPPVVTVPVAGSEPKHEELYPMIAMTDPQPDSAAVAKDVHDNEAELPEQSVFYFGFNKAEVTADDLATLQEHADYLRANPELIVQIEGHTDFHGPRAYNEQLSKQRAQAIAKILLDNGVPQAQLAVNALADNKPMECKGDTRHNRRVELTYKDTHIASNP